MGQAGIAARLAVDGFLRGQRFEGTFPSRAERRYPQRALQLIGGMSRQIEQRVDIRDGEALRPVRDLYDLVAGADLALLEHPEIEPRPVVRHQQGGHPRLVHPNADPVARHPRLRDLEQRAADAIAVADADLVVRQAVHGEVFAELPEGEIAAAERVLPVPIGVALVDHHGTMLAAVAAEIPLPVSRKVQPPDDAAARNRTLPDAGVYGLAAPLDVLGQADVDSEQSCHEHLTRLRQKPTFCKIRTQLGPERLGPKRHRPRRGRRQPVVVAPPISCNFVQHCGVVPGGEDRRVVLWRVRMTDDRTVRAALDRHWEASDAGDFEAEHEIYREDAVLEYPQSGERIRGRRIIQESRFVQPNKKRFTVRRIIGGGDLWVTEFVLAYDGIPSYAVSIMEFRDGLVARETQYFADRFDPAPSRAHLVER